MNAIAVVRAFVVRDWRLAKTHPASLVLALVGVPIEVGIYYFTGRLVRPDASAFPRGLHGGYFTYVLGGMVLGQVLSVGLTAFAARLREEQLAGTLEALAVTQLRPTQTFLGLIAYEMADAMLQFALLLACGVVVFGAAMHLSSHTVLALLIALPSAVGLLLGVGAIVGATALVYKNPEIVMRPVSLIILVLGGVFFPISVMPAPLRQLAEISPFTWAVDWVRGGLFGGPASTWQLVALAGTAPLSLAVGTRILRSAMRRARRDGSLALY